LNSGSACCCSISLSICYLKIKLLKYTKLQFYLDLRETGWSGMDWIVLAQDREQWRTLVIMVMDLQVP
jgi:hypothetical protein